jgi:hypothetical protein
MERFILLGQLTLTLASLSSCNVGVAQFHSAWSRRVMILTPAIQRYYEKTGHLPGSLSDAIGDDFPLAEVRLVQYKREGNDRYVLWIHARDIEQLAISPGLLAPTPGDATPGDIFGRFDPQGRVLEASWMSTSGHKAKASP